jgi:predicted Rossmann fold flavoprotein
MKTDILIIGAGPAGLFTAICCEGLQVTLLEKMSSAGKKLLISGSGRCNLTHEGRLSDFFSHYGSNHRFLKTALHAFTPGDLIRFFGERGLDTVTDKNGKVFPETQKASDVLGVLLGACEQNGALIRTALAAQQAGRTETGFRVQTPAGTLEAGILVITTGGMSYPATGSTGDGYMLAKQLGHSIVPPKPSLSPVFIREYGMADLAGISVPEAVVSIYRDGRKLMSRKGDIGFTHRGLSGPGILDFSRFIHSGDVLKINFAGLNPDVLRQELTAARDTAGTTAIQTWLKKLGLPRSLTQHLLMKCGVGADTTLAALRKEERNAVVASFSECPFTVEKVGGFNTAMVTSGGVSLEEVNPKTMESRIVPGLFFAGEVLDIDGDTGGYNLQAAFSTAFVAAARIREILDSASAEKPG